MNKKIIKRIYNVVIILCFIGAIGWCFSHFYHGSDVVYTDDAQVNRHITPINTRVSGFIKEIRFSDYQHVKKGDTLVIIEDSEFRLHVAQAEAGLRGSKAGSSVVSASMGTTTTNVQTASAGIEEARVDMMNAKQDFDRFAALMKKDAVTRQQYDNAYARYLGFKYSSFSLEDAIAFDAKLRQWQISAILPAVQKSYTDIQQTHQKKTRNMLVVMSVLVFLLLGGSFALFRLYRRQIEYSRRIAEMNKEIKQSSDTLADINKRLKKMNRELKEANAAKEEYIGLFLSMCSNYIDKMKAYQSGVRKLALAGNLDKLIADTSSPDNVEKELKEFYEMFDKAFLKLYPKFVEQFNGLLREDARIELKKGKLLNTELRIFALIRLGITQSSDIASMLRYSVNTIYNYRAQIKNSALGDRDNFEERIKEIGN